MNVVRVNPFLQGKNFNNLVDNVFNRSISDLVGSDFAISNPSVNVSETNDEIILEIAAPGLDKKDFNIQIDKDQLIVSASSENTPEEVNEGKWTKREFNYSSFKRSFHISDHLDTDSIRAEYINGILILNLPKKEEAKAKPARTIEIK